MSPIYKVVQNEKRALYVHLAKIQTVALKGQIGYLIHFHEGSAPLEQICQTREERNAEVERLVDAWTAFCGSKTLN